jgi:uncharacterized delta-60 repeat protein
MEQIMLLNRIAMFLLLIMVFLTGFPHCLKLDTLSFFPSIKLYLYLTKHIKDSGNSDNNNSGSSDNSNNNNSGSNRNTFTGAIGVLDTRFNFPNGFIIQPIGSSDDVGSPLAIQSDGKILLGGSCKNGSNINFCIARFNSDGTLDITFGTRGKVIQPIGSDDDKGHSLAIQPDGKILLGGSCYTSKYDFCFARSRFNPNCRSLILFDFKSLDFCIARFNSNGTLDTSFGSSGIVIQPIGSSDDIGYSLAIQSDGKILLGGYCYTGSYYDLCIARYNSNGTLDTTFGSSGKVIQPISSSYDDVYSLAIQPDGKILLGGFCYNGSNGDFCIARFNSNGTLDTSFGTNGKVTQPIGSSIDEGYSLAIQLDGKILLGGICSNGSNPDFCIARFQ